jgi:hypothetical protein
MLKKTKRDGHVPVSFLHQLNEHCAGGFVLFYFNSEDGSPEQVMTFDSPAHCLALQKHVADWSMALQDLTIENEKQIIENMSKSANAGEDEEQDVI